ncbi:MAG: uncharacterized protein JWQ99_626 [Blastococcus sp.]|nr:uncharacterized protein [Blastococcus sp.]
MSPSITTTDELDLEISVAYIALGGARAVWERCPTGDNARRVVGAEAEVDRLLDARLAARS